MKKQKFAILDMEDTYAQNLMEYLAERQSIPFDTLVFDSVESLGLYTQRSGVDLLLVSAKMMCEDIRRMNIRRIIILSEGEIQQEYEAYPMVYKYQSSESLVAEVMGYYARQAAPAPCFLGKKKMNIAGVYSPVGRCGKTCFALALGQVMAGERPVLYLNLEDYSGFDLLLEKEASSDISDVMYFLRQDNGNAALRINAAIQKLGRMDYIPPARSPEDIREIRIEEWLRLLEELAAYSRYETVILDIGQHIREAPSLLAQCGVIYMPVCMDAVSQAKVAQYERLLRDMEYGELIGRTRKLVLPYTAPRPGGDCFPEQLAGGEMGSFVRDLLRKETQEYGA